MWFKGQTTGVDYSGHTDTRRLALSLIMIRTMEIPGGLQGNFGIHIRRLITLEQDVSHRD